MNTNTAAKITDSKGGTGLGLAIFHGIVVAHGGCFDIQSEVGKGSTFLIYLPTV